MLNIQRHHDFQVFLSPTDNQVAETNPPSFNWPQQDSQSTYTLKLTQLGADGREWKFENVSSPLQLNFTLPEGQYQWQLVDQSSNASNLYQFEITADSIEYLPPTAQDLFALCEGRDQFLMYFYEDLADIEQASTDAYHKLTRTAALSCHIDDIRYPTHYRRGEELGKRTAIDNSRLWIDRDLMANCLLYKIWGEAGAGEQARCILLTLAQWSPEGAASVLRPCTWGDEVGLSLTRNLFLAYHWLAPLLTDAEKAIIRPMLIRMAHQMELRLQSDEFHQFPGHSHTSRLPGYLGVAALVLHREYDRQQCAKWLDYALMIYKGILPFYGGSDGSWAEGAFYSSSYTKWHHTFFLAVERISGFSFYEHPFYKNYCRFAMDFVVPEHSIHPFGDGFWCNRDSVEWPGFFAQNPLRIYAQRFGDHTTLQASDKLEEKIDTYQLHLLDVIPTLPQLSINVKRKLAALNAPQASIETKHHAAQTAQQNPTGERFYQYAGFGAIHDKNSSLYYRASPFGNSSHRHADQGNLAFFDGLVGVLTPTGSYGYCFGSSHHNNWTRTTKAHNLPLFEGQGQILDNEAATAKVLSRTKQGLWQVVRIDLSKAYLDAQQFIRTLVFIPGAGVVVLDQVTLHKAKTMQWRTHSHMQAKVAATEVQLTFDTCQYQCAIIGNEEITPTIEFGYQDEISGAVIQSDASQEVTHLEWNLPLAQTHQVIFSCVNSDQVKINQNDEQLNISYEGESLTIPFADTI